MIDLPLVCMCKGGSYIAIHSSMLSGGGLLFEDNTHKYGLWYSHPLLLLSYPLILLKGDSSKRHPFVFSAV